MIINGFNKLTLLDYPKHMACIIFTKGCNFNCSYCQNSSLISLKDEEKITEEEIFNFLKMRKNVLEGVVISGGEPTIQKDLIPFIKKIKDLGYKIKLDTNGYNPSTLKYLIDNKLIDYVAMDIKNDLENYEKVTKNKININVIKESINILLNSDLDMEFRTTIIKQYHDLKNIKNIIKLIKDKKYYIQNFVLSDDVQDKTLHGFTDLELIKIRKDIGYQNKNIKIRGIINSNLITKEEEVYYV